METTHWLLLKCKGVGSLLSVRVHSGSLACDLLVRGVPPVSEQLFTTNRILSNTFSFLWHYTDLWRKAWTTWQFSFLTFSFSLHLSLQAQCPQVSLLHKPLHMGSRKMTLLLATWCFRLHYGFPSSCIPPPPRSWKDLICASLDTVSKLIFTPYPTVKFSEHVCLLTIQIDW